MTLYTKPILRYGLITPVLFNLVLLGGIAAGFKKLSSVRTHKEERHAEHTLRVQSVKFLEAQIAPKRPQFDDQSKLLAADQRQIFTKILDTSLRNYDRLELQRSSLVVPPGKGRLGRHIDSNLSRVRSSFQGGVGPMQETLLQLDALMPQISLEEISITRQRAAGHNESDLLVMDATHTAWKSGHAQP